MVFDAFAIQGRVSSVQVLTDGTGWKPSGETREVFNEMPGENVVVAFPPGPRAPGCTAN